MVRSGSSAPSLASCGRGSRPRQDQALAQRRSTSPCGSSRWGSRAPAMPGKENGEAARASAALETWPMMLTGSHPEDAGRHRLQVGLVTVAIHQVEERTTPGCDAPSGRADLGESHHQGGDRLVGLQIQPHRRVPEALRGPWRRRAVEGDRLFVVGVRRKQVGIAATKRTGLLMSGCR